MQNNSHDQASISALQAIRTSAATAANKTTIICAGCMSKLLSGLVGPRPVKGRSTNCGALPWLEGLVFEVSLLPEHDLLAAQANVFPTSDRERATAQSTFGRDVSTRTQLLVERPGELCAGPDRRAQGCAEFALASFAKCRRSRAGARRNVWCREPTLE